VYCSGRNEIAKLIFMKENLGGWIIAFADIPRGPTLGVLHLVYAMKNLF
jgi:hypothetical protein